jgi:hypothetical protein
MDLFPFYRRILLGLEARHLGWLCLGLIRRSDHLPRRLFRKLLKLLQRDID